MPKGRILVLFGSIPLYGQERANIEVIHALVTRGWDALFVTHPEWGHQQVQPALDARGLRWTTATFADRFDRGMGVGGWLRRLRQMVRGNLELARIVRTYRPTHIHLGNPQWFIAFAPLLLLLRTPIVYRLGDAPAQHRLAFRVLWRCVLGRRVTRFVCISNFLRTRLLAAAPVADKCELAIPRPVARFVSRPEPLPEKDPASTTFVYVGQMTEEKGVGLVVEAAMRLSREGGGVRFLLAGDVSWKNPFAEALMAEVHRAGLENTVVFLGFVEDVPRLLAVGDVHLCPSLCQEGLGTTVLEAKEAGLPSIVFPSGGLPELVTDGVDGTVCQEKTVEALVAACRRYLEEPDLAPRQGAAARVSLVRLGVAEFAERWDALYSDCR